MFLTLACTGGTRFGKATKMRLMTMAAEEDPTRAASTQSPTERERVRGALTPTSCPTSAELVLLNPSITFGRRRDRAQTDDLSCPAGSTYTSRWLSSSPARIRLDVTEMWSPPL